MANGQTTTRRNVLKAAPAVMVAGALPALAEPEGEIATLFAEWMALHRDTCDPRHSRTMPEADFDRFVIGRTVEMDAIADRIYALPCRGAADVARKVICDTDNFEFDMKDFAAEFRSLARIG